MPARPKASAALKDRIRGMHERGEDCRGIETTLKSEGISLHFTTISRILKEAKPEIRPSAARRDAQPRRESVHTREEREQSIEEPIVISDDPRELARQDWLYYEKLKERLRREANKELDNRNIRGYRDLLREAQTAEKRAAELRPPIPPDPQKDPAYVSATRDLTSYIAALIARAELGEPIPTRTLPPLEPSAL